ELLPDAPHLVELPDRGPGADMIGRTSALLTDLAVDLQPSGWRLVPRAGRDLRRARDLLDRDLDALAIAADGYRGPLKLQSAGPWTFAAGVELPRGDRALSDRGAVMDLAASLADGLGAHLQRVRALLPAATLWVQLDEPSLPAVLAGRVPTASGFGRLRVPEEPELDAVLATVLRALPTPGVHCCAADVPLALLRTAGAAWVSLDATLLRPGRDDDALGEALDAGTGLVLGIEGDPQPAQHLLDRLGLAPDRWRSQVLLTPRCGLAGRSEAAAWELLRAVRSAARQLAEQD
ncbi:MAG TPA: methionine synthase, partial [Mycobacteriales bacterium]|nr:methionine synthase [Mycobacteriales bacterium]